MSSLPRIDTYPSIISCVQIPSLPSSRSEFAPFKNSSGPFINRFIRTRCEENEHFFKAVQNEVISFVIKSIRVFEFDSDSVSRDFEATVYPAAALPELGGMGRCDSDPMRAQARRYRDL